VTFTVLFVQVGNRNVPMETHVVNFPQDNGVVVHFHEQSAAVMEYIAVLMDTPALVDIVQEEAKSCLC